MKENRIFFPHWIGKAEI